jgi:hypothetical protein
VLDQVIHISKRIKVKKWKMLSQVCCGVKKMTLPFLTFGPKSHRSKKSKVLIAITLLDVKKKNHYTLGFITHLVLACHSQQA